MESERKEIVKCPFCKQDMYKTDNNIQGVDSNGRPCYVDIYECTNDGYKITVKHKNGEYIRKERSRGDIIV